MKTLTGGFCVENPMAEYIESELKKKLSNFVILDKRDAKKEDILSANPGLPTNVAEYCEANKTHSSFVFQFECSDYVIESIADSLLEPMLWALDE